MVVREALQDPVLDVGDAEKLRDVLEKLLFGFAVANLRRLMHWLVY